MSQNENPNYSHVEINRAPDGTMIFALMDGETQVGHKILSGPTDPTILDLLRIFFPEEPQEQIKTAEEIKTIVAAYADSGASIKVFAGEIGVPHQSLAAWLDTANLRALNCAEDEELVNAAYLRQFALDEAEAAKKD